jgi:hypothetical protein
MAKETPGEPKKTRLFEFEVAEILFNEPGKALC